MDDHDRIDALTSENARLRGALERIAALRGDEDPAELLVEALGIADATLRTEDVQTGQGGAMLDARMKAAGMFTVDEMMGRTALTRWHVQAGMEGLEEFGQWLDRKVAEYLRMRVPYELGEKSRDDDLYEWILAHVGAFSAVRTNFRAAITPREGSVQ